MGLTPTARARLPEMDAPASEPNKIVRIVIAPGGQQDQNGEGDPIEGTAREAQLINVTDSFDD